MSCPIDPEELAEYFRSIGHAPARSAELADAFVASAASILTEIEKFYPSAEIDPIGPLSSADLGPWGCWIRIDTDNRRDVLSADETLMRHLAKAAEEGGWAAIITIESQETVDRDYEGSWFYRLR